MLKITVPETELFNEETNEFLLVKKQELTLEHSLISLSKWESKWHKPYLLIDEEHRHSTEEIIDYIRCMTLTQNVDPLVFLCLTEENFKAINEYIEDSHTATWFNNRNQKKSRRIVTSELIYCWMSQLNIPYDICQKWHLNRLLTLIRVCSEEQQPAQKMPKKEAMSRQRALNEARRKARHSKG